MGRGCRRIDAQIGGGTSGGTAGCVGGSGSEGGGCARAANSRPRPGTSIVYARTVILAGTEPFAP
jgi:hypothetical protein